MKINGSIFQNEGYDILADPDCESPLIIDQRKKVIKEYLPNPAPSLSAPVYFANSKGCKVLMQGYWEAVLMIFPEQSVVSTMYDTGILPIAFSLKRGEEDKLYAIIKINYYSHFALLNFQNRRTEFQFPTNEKSELSEVQMVSICCWRPKANYIR